MTLTPLTYSGNYATLLKNLSKSAAEMTRIDKISEAQAVVEAEREAVRACKEEIAEIEVQLSESKRKLAEKEASLSVAERMFSIFEPQNNGATGPAKESPKRRMRLGAKKRAIYMLVSKKVSTIDQIETHLTVVNNTDIDRRYIRDVVRDALTSGDMAGEIEREFVMTDLGRDILDKAPAPAGWETYRDAAEMRLPSASASTGGQHFFGGGRLVDLEDEDPFAETEVSENDDLI